MDKQPIALMLAEKLEQQFPLGTAQRYLDGEAAAELRRLHAENEELTKKLASYQTQHPIAWGMRNKVGQICDCITPDEHEQVAGAYDIALYAAPLSLSWQSLTVEEVSEVDMHIKHKHGIHMNEKTRIVMDFVRAIEDKLREKNT